MVGMPKPIWVGIGTCFYLCAKMHMVGVSKPIWVGFDTRLIGTSFDLCAKMHMVRSVPKPIWVRFACQNAYGPCAKTDLGWNWHSFRFVCQNAYGPCANRCAEIDLVGICPPFHLCVRMQMVGFGTGFHCAAQPESSFAPLAAVVDFYDATATVLHLFQ
jgi:hypothetical protein